MATPKPPQKLTPMMRQYLEIKKQNQDGILFYRLGDFYEMFYDDAVVASRLLDLTLTTRNKNSGDPVPLCGVPYHSAEPYIAKLVAKGKKVVICEQTEDPKQAKGIVRREVTRVVSPGVVLEEASLPGRAHCFLLSVNHQKSGFFGAVCDVSTGSLSYQGFSSLQELGDAVSRLFIREVVYAESLRDNTEFIKALDELQVYHHAVADLYFDSDYARDLLFDQYAVLHLSSLGLQEKDPAVGALGGVLGYLKESKTLTSNLLEQPVPKQSGSSLYLDEMAVRNLELFQTLRDQDSHGTLFWHLDRCLTPMGSRCLMGYLQAPLVEVKEINRRLDAVEALVKDSELLQRLREVLKPVADLERLANKFVVGSASARDAVALKTGLEMLPQLKEQLASLDVSLWQELALWIKDFLTLVKVIAKTLVEEPPLSLKDGGLIRAGVHKELDELREIEKNGKSYIAGLESKERGATGISSLKIRYNNVFGYYIEVTHTHKDKVPEHYIRKQTLTNAERYITDELKKYESKVLGASERIKAIEYEVFQSLRENIKERCVEVKESAQAVAVADVLQSLAHVAKSHNYTRPQMTTGTVLHLSAARHPILERLVDDFVSNDISLDESENRLLIITGPNMAGKSTIMRMAALSVIMAQMGGFVPCGAARIGVCDRVFTRVGAHDHLQKGLSTFMVEMVETARILREATPRSLILLDEIGRGTSTFDGLSIAWAVTEDIHDRLQARTLFATHYHELCDLASQKSGVQNVHMAVKEYNQQVIFLRKLASGGTNRSYGVAVAGMAGLPEHTVKRAREVLKLLEMKDLRFQSDVGEQAGVAQMSLFAERGESEVEKVVREVDLEGMTPLGALNFLFSLKERVS